MTAPAGGVECSPKYPVQGSSALYRPLLCSRRFATHFTNPLQAVALQQMEWNVRRALSGDTSAISTLRVLHLYLERLGSRHLPSAALQVRWTTGASCAASFVWQGPVQPCK